MVDLPPYSNLIWALVNAELPGQKRTDGKPSGSPPHGAGMNVVFVTGQAKWVDWPSRWPGDSTVGNAPPEICRPFTIAAD